MFYNFRLKILVETLESQLAETNSALNKSVDGEYT